MSVHLYTTSNCRNPHSVCVFQGSVRALLHDKIRDAYTHPQFVTDVMKPMQIESIIDQDVSTPGLFIIQFRGLAPLQYTAHTGQLKHRFTGHTGFVSVCV